jgi:hypothetical protein
VGEVVVDEGLVVVVVRGRVVVVAAEKVVVVVAPLPVLPDVPEVPVAELVVVVVGGAGGATKALVSPLSVATLLEGITARLVQLRAEFQLWTAVVAA